MFFFRFSIFPCHLISKLTSPGLGDSLWVKLILFSKSPSTEPIKVFGSNQTKYEKDKYCRNGRVQSNMKVDKNVD